MSKKKKRTRTRINRRKAAEPQRRGNAVEQSFDTLLESARLSSPPRALETERLVSLFVAQLEHYRNDLDAALNMATIPLGALPDGLEAAEIAAWTVVASLLLNLDETLSKG